MSQVKKAIIYFEKQFNCCQAVFTPFGVETGLDEELCLKIAAGFGGGMCSNGETCGVVIGAYLTLGLFYGHSEANDDKSKEIYKALIDEFIEQFEERNGSIICNELLGADLSTKEGFDYLKKNEIFNKKCPNFIGDAVSILNDII